MSKRSALARHILLVHNKIRPFECSDCLKKFGIRSNLNHHIQVVHDKLKTFECHRCVRKYSKKSALTRHIQIVHEKVKPFECSVCSKKFGASNQVKFHMNNNHNQFGCSHCTVKFGGKKKLNIHMKSAHKQLDQSKQNNSKEKKLRKKKCSETFGDISSLEECNSDLLSTNNPQCEPNTNIINRKSMELEKVSKSNNFDEDFKSDVEVEDDDEIVVLQEIKQTESSGYKCDICNQPQPDVQSLKDHFRQSHASDRAFLCKICRIRFTEEVNFKLHNKMNH